MQIQGQSVNCVKNFSALAKRYVYNHDVLYQIARERGAAKNFAIGVCDTLSPVFALLSALRVSVNGHQT